MAVLEKGVGDIEKVGETEWKPLGGGEAERELEAGSKPARRDSSQACRWTLKMSIVT